MAKLLFIVFLMFFSNIVAAEHSHQKKTLKISPVEMKEVIENTIIAFETFYLYPENTKHVSEKLHAMLHSDHLQEPYDREEFRKEVRSVLIKATHDTGIDVSATEQPLNNIAALQQNGQITTEISENNIGYLSISENLNFDHARQLISNTMSSMSNVEALIIDLRSADKTNLPLVLHLLSYFFANDTLVGNIQTAKKFEPMLMTKTSNNDNFKTNFPLYILDSPFVAGEWEFFSHALQTAGKAIVIGKNTMGIGHFTQSVKVGHNVVLEIPYSTLQHASSGETWEQQGVTADYFTESEDAINKAYGLATSKLLIH